MSFAWTYSKWATNDPQSGKTGIFIGSFMRSTDKIFQQLEGTRKAKVKQFKQICFDALRRIQDRTPVDTGNAKAGWRLTFTVDTDTQVKASITNGVTYVIYLEYGWSKQAPRGMVRITMMGIAAEIREGKAGAPELPAEALGIEPPAPPRGWRW